MWAFSFITGWRRRALGCSCLAWDTPGDGELEAYPLLVSPHRHRLLLWIKPRFLKMCWQNLFLGGEFAITARKLAWYEHSVFGCQVT